MMITRFEFVQKQDYPTVFSSENRLKIDWFPFKSTHVISGYL